MSNNTDSAASAAPSASERGKHLMLTIANARHFMCGAHIQTEVVSQAIVQEWLGSIESAAEIALAAYAPLLQQAAAALEAAIAYAKSTHANGGEWDDIRAALAAVRAGLGKE